GAAGNVSPAACCRAAVLPIVRRAVIPVVAVVRGGVVTPVVGVDVGKLPPPEIGAPIGIAEPSLWPRFVDVDARNISFCPLSRHGQDCSRHHGENAEQGVAGLAHSPLHWIQSAVSASASEDHERGIADRLRAACAGTSLLIPGYLGKLAPPGSETPPKQRSNGEQPQGALASERRGSLCER